MITGEPMEDVCSFENVVGNNETITTTTTTTTTTAMMTPQPPITFPIARIKRIIKADKRINTCNNDAATYMAAAAEVFLTELTKSSDAVCELDKRRTIQYKDVAQAIANDERLFPVLGEIVPKTVSLQEAISFQQNLTKQVTEEDPFLKNVANSNSGRDSGRSDGSDETDKKNKDSGDIINEVVPIGITTCDDGGNVSVQVINSPNQSSDTEDK